jgi:hypothetical protein
LASSACAAASPDDAQDPSATDASRRGSSSISVSPSVVSLGESIQIEITAAEGYTWGPASILEKRTPRDGWEPVARLILLPSRRNHVYEFTPLDARGAVPLVSFRGDYIAEALVPELRPGRYRLTKTFDSEDGAADSQHAAAAFEVRAGAPSGPTRRRG